MDQKLRLKSPLGWPGQGKPRDWEKGEYEEIRVSTYDISSIMSKLDKSRNGDLSTVFGDKKEAIRKTEKC